MKRAGPADVTLYLAPTLDTQGGNGGRIGVSLDDGPMHVLQAHLEATGGAQDNPAKMLWAQSVCDNVMRLTASVGQVSVGRHRIRIWRLDDNMVLQKLVFATEEVPASYLGPGAGPL